MVVSFASPNQNFLKMVNNIKFMLAPMSHSTFLKIRFPMEHEIVKLPGLLSFYGNFSKELHYTLLIRPLSHNLLVFSSLSEFPS